MDTPKQPHVIKQKIDNVMSLSIFESVKHRLPWLVIGLIGGILAAKVVQGFEATIAKHLFLTAFIPLIVYMSDAVGTQMESFVIRDFVLHPKFNFIHYFFKQLTVIGCIATILSTALFLFGYILYGQTAGIVLGLSLFFSITSSVVTGLILPDIFERLKLDPANASGPIATIIQDLLSVSIYFTVASLLLG